jgi:prepilin-type N-terminal cleavage/methylation domain-containing protein
MAQRPDKAGFTLVEVMVVISVIILLAGLLTPSVVAIREAWLREQTKMQLGNLRMAIWSYAGEVRLGRAIPPSLPPTVPPPSDAPKDVNTGQTLDKFYTTGAEALFYYLQGGGGRGFKITWNGVESVVGPFYGASPDEVRLSYDAAIKSGGNWMGMANAPTSSASRRVFVDKYSTLYGSQQAQLTRPVLYWAARPITAAGGNPYVLADNEEIIQNVNGAYRWSNADYKAQFDAKLQYKGGTYLSGTVLVSPGLDRKYMTDDDIVDLAERN